MSKSEDDSFNERVVFTGEVYVICGECGARVWSRDATPEDKHDDVLSVCPYKKRGYDVALKYGCVSSR